MCASQRRGMCVSQKPIQGGAPQPDKRNIRINHKHKQTSKVVPIMFPSAKIATQGTYNGSNQNHVACKLLEDLLDVNENLSKCSKTRRPVSSALPHAPKKAKSNQDPRKMTYKHDMHWH